MDDISTLHVTAQDVTDEEVTNDALASLEEYLGAKVGVRQSQQTRSTWPPGPSAETAKRQLSSGRSEIHENVAREARLLGSYLRLERRLTVQARCQSLTWRKPRFFWSSRFCRRATRKITEPQSLDSRAWNTDVGHKHQQPHVHLSLPSSEPHWVRSSAESRSAKTDGSGKVAAHGRDSFRRTSSH